VRPDKLPQVVFVGVDPQRDAPVMADYVAHFDPNFIGVTGSHEELAKLVKGIDGFYRIGKPKKDGDYEVQHSASVIVTGPDGRVHAKLSPPLDPGGVAEYLARKQIAYARAQRNN
jgi:protein SCO1/2